MVVVTRPIDRRHRALRGYCEGMGVIGELFPGQKLADEGGEDSDGQTHRPRFDIDLDTGVARVPRQVAPQHTDETTE